MSLDSAQLTSTMLHAALGVLKQRTPHVRDYAEREFAKLARSLVAVERELAAGTITSEEAALEIQAERENSQAVLSTVDGLGQLAAEEAIGAAVRAIRGTVNEAVAYQLL